MHSNFNEATEINNPWLATQVTAQLDSMSAACNELHRANRHIMFIVPIAHVIEASSQERPTSHIAILSLPTINSNKAI